MRSANDDCDVVALHGAMIECLERYGPGATDALSRVAIERSGASPGQRIAELSPARAALASAASERGADLFALRPGANAGHPPQGHGGGSAVGEGFDAAIAFFDEEAEGALIARMVRLVRPGGRVVIVRWAEPHGPQWSRIVAQALRRTFPLCPRRLGELPSTPADGLSRDVGMHDLADVEIGRERLVTLWPPLEHLVDELVVPGFVGLDDGGRERLLASLRSLLRPHADEVRGIVRLTSEVLLVTATRTSNASGGTIRPALPSCDERHAAWFRRARPKRAWSDPVGVTFWRSAGAVLAEVCRHTGAAGDER